MAVFSDHNPGAITFGILGNIVSVMVYFAPLPTFVRIYREKSTLGFHSVPYNVAFFSAMLWLYYAFLKKNAPLLISINSFGCVIETFYIVTYLYYASRRARIDTAKLACLMNVVIFPIVFVLTFFIFKDPAERAQVVGWICVAVSVSVFAAPLSIVFQVVQTRSVEYMPFPLSFFLTLSAVMWFSYGVFEKDLCVALPNVVGFFLGLLQMVLYGFFRKPNRPEIIEEEKLPEHVLTIMVLGTPEVHPVDSEKRGDEVIPVENTIKEEEAADPLENFVPCALSVEPGPVNLQKDSAVFEVCAA